MADKRISDAAAVTTETTVYVPGGAGGAPLKVATTAVGREVMGAASAAAARAALELDDRYARLGADNEYGGVQTVTDGVTGTVTVGPGQIVLVMGDLTKSTAPLVRLHSSCFTGDLVGTLIMLYAMCGFANFASLGIMIGGGIIAAVINATIGAVILLVATLVLYYVYNKLIGIDRMKLG